MLQMAVFSITMLNNREQLREQSYDLRSMGASWVYIGSVLGVSRKIAKRLYEEFVVSNAEAIGDIITSTPYVEDYYVDVSRFKPIQYTGDAIVTCDWHVPLHDSYMVNSLFKKAVEYDIDTLIIAGDFFNQDQTSSYSPKQREADFKTEKQQGTMLMDTALSVFDKIIFIWGNHDFRFVKFMNYMIDFEYSMRWLLSDLEDDKLSRIEFSNLDHMVYNPGGYDIHVCHPENFSSIPLTVARDLVPKYNMSVLTAHSHHFAQGVARDGRNRTFDGGGLFSQEKTEYIRRTNKHHRWVSGFHVFKDGLCYPYSPAYSNL